MPSATTKTSPRGEWIRLMRSWFSSRTSPRWAPAPIRRETEGLSFITPRELQPPCREAQGPARHAPVPPRLANRPAGFVDRRTRASRQLPRAVGGSPHGASRLTQDVDCWPHGGGQLTHDVGGWPRDVGGWPRGANSSTRGARR